METEYRAYPKGTPPAEGKRFPLFKNGEYIGSFAGKQELFSAILDDGGDSIDFTFKNEKLFPNKPEDKILRAKFKIQKFENGMPFYDIGATFTENWELSKESVLEKLEPLLIDKDS